MAWRILSMSEAWDALFEDKNSSVFIKLTFPTRRWGQTFTVTSTTCKKSIARIIEHYQNKGIKIRKRIDHHTNDKFPKLGKFYYLEILEES